MNIKFGVITSSNLSVALLKRGLDGRAQPVFQAGESVLFDRERLEELRRLAPDVILVETQRTDAVIEAVTVLRRLLPGNWLLAVGEDDDPQLIIDVVRAGAREFIPRPVTPQSLSGAFSRYLAEHPGGDRVPGQVLLVTSAKGGSGTTSVAINLATAISALPKTRVGLVDLVQPLGDVAAYLNLKPRYTLVDALAAADRLDPVLLETFVTQAHNLSILPASRDFQPETGADPEALVKTLGVCGDSCSHVVVDLPSSLPKEHFQGIAALAGRIVVVLTPEIPALWRTHRLLGFLRECGFDDKIGVLLNRSQRNDEITVRDISKTLGVPIQWKLPNDYRAAIEAVNSGLPLVSVNHSGLATAFQVLARDLTGIRAEQPKRKFFSFFA